MSSRACRPMAELFLVQPLQSLLNMIYPALQSPGRSLQA